MNKTLIAALTVVIILVTGAILLYQNQTKQTTQSITEQTSPNQTIESFSNPKKAAHYESNTPEHGSTLAGVPVNIVIDFNFDLAPGSEIQILSGGKDYGQAETKIDEGGLAARRDLNPDAPDGLYTVEYKACWADGSCHDGNFQFRIDRSLAANFTDLRSQKEVAIELKNIAFNPQTVRIGKGTKVTWVNIDDFEHTVNTDIHPAHTYYPLQNSRTLNNGDTYSVTFDNPGIYLYHCTPHATTMRGQILVD